MTKKPAGYDAFDSLTRKLMTVPKEKVDAKIAADRAARKKAAKKKK